MGYFRDLMDREMRIRGFADRTRQSYLGCVRRFVGYYMVRPDRLTLEDVNRYQLYLTRDRQVAWSTFNQSVCALRFFFIVTLKRDWNLQQLPYHKRRRRLPQVLSRLEVRALFDSVQNLKHRAILMTLYGGGLRVSEALSLRVTDIDSDRMTIRIHWGKGGKDRYVMLSQTLLIALRDYWHHYHPQGLLFPGRGAHGQLTRASVGKVIKKARKRAGIVKPVSPHTLRHSFATHLLEAGINIRVIQRLLGHRSLRSTEVYTHVARNYVADTQSPLDSLPLLDEVVGHTAGMDQ
jgi:site-specific recombinase XerD